MYYKIISSASWRTFAKLENRNHRIIGFDHDVVLGCISLCTEKQLHKQITSGVFRYVHKGCSHDDLVILALRVFPTDQVCWLKKELDEEDYPYLYSPIMYKNVCWTERVSNTDK